MEAVQLFLTAFDHRWDTFRIRLDACRKASSEAAVHDLRVAARRLLAFVEIAHLLDPHPRLLKIRRALKDLIDGFDELRDVQVMLALLGPGDMVGEVATLLNANRSATISSMIPSPYSPREAL